MTIAFNKLHFVEVFFLNVVDQLSVNWQLKLVSNLLRYLRESLSIFETSLFVYSSSKCTYECQLVTFNEWFGGQNVKKVCFCSSTISLSFCLFVYKIHTVNPQKRPAGLILSLRVQMQVLLEFGLNLSLFAYCFLSFLRVLFEGGSLSKI